MTTWSLTDPDRNPLADGLGDLLDLLGYDVEPDWSRSRACGAAEHTDCDDRPQDQTERCTCGCHQPGWDDAP